MAREGSGPAPVQSALTLLATLLSPSKSISHRFSSGDAKLRKGYIHIIQTSRYNPKAATGATVKVGNNDTEVELKEGDGAYIHGAAGQEITVENVGDTVAEVLLFDLE
jgi:hypothetical protein